MIDLSIPQLPIPQMNGNYSFSMEMFMHLGLSDTYGNLNLKNMDYAQKHHYINQLLREVYFDHTLEKHKIRDEIYTVDNLFYKVKNNTETLIYWLRKSADDYISLAYLTYYLYIKKQSVGQFAIDSIGSLLYGKNDSEVRSVLKEAFGSHLHSLNILNEVSNTFKHAFAHHEIMHLIGKDEPTVIELSTNKNDFTKPLKYNSYSLRQIVQNYTVFYLDAESQIKKWIDEWMQRSIEENRKNESNKDEQWNTLNQIS